MVTVIVPVYNEEEKIKNTILALKNIAYIDNIYIINDGSKDKTYEKIKDINNINIINQPYNKGKGQALYRGVQLALEHSTIIIFVDGDLGESAKEAEKLVWPILQGRADVTIGSLPPAKKKGGFGLIKKLAQIGVYINTGKKINTSLSGQRAFKKDVLENMDPNIYFAYGVELGMTIDILNKGYRVMEIDVDMVHNETGRDLKGFLHRGRQFWQILIVLLYKTVNTRLGRG